MSASSDSPAFYAYGKEGYYKENTIITFNGTSLNIGNVFNATTGIFTAPVKGLYYFFFSCMKHWSFTSVTIRLMHNGAEVSTKHLRAQLNGATGPGDNYLFLDIQATLSLNVNDTVYIVLVKGAISDMDANWLSRATTFTGFLIQPN